MFKEGKFNSPGKETWNKQFARTNSDISVPRSLTMEPAKKSDNQLQHTRCAESLALEHVEKNYPFEEWTHIYTDGSVENAIKIKVLDFYQVPKMEGTKAYPILQVDNLQISKQRQKPSRLAHLLFWWEITHKKKHWLLQRRQVSSPSTKIGTRSEWYNGSSNLSMWQP